MKTESILELINLCVSGDCAISLRASKVGVMVNVTAARGMISAEASVYLDPNHPNIGEQLKEAVERVR